MGIILLNSQVSAEPLENEIRAKILSTFLSSPKKELFKVYHFIFKKEYDLNSSEGVNRYKIFKNNLKFIEESNAKNLTYKLGVNKFTDVSDEEFRQKYLNLNLNLESLNSNSIDNESNFLSNNVKGSNYFDLFADADDIDTKSQTEFALADDFNSIDYKKYFLTAKDQGSCGSCWAHSAIGAIEGNYAKNFGVNLRFSEQQLVDCSPYTNGCRGSDPSDAYKYILESGIAYSFSYPYTSGIIGAKGTCKYNKDTQNFVLTDSKKCTSSKCTRQIVREMLNQGPIVVLLDGEGNGVLQKYESGILSMTCKNPNHGIIMVGLDVDENGKEYYTGRNSWGSDWGENGYFRIYVNDIDRTCFMESYALLPILKETNIPVPPPPQPECTKFYSECNLQGNVFETCESVAVLNPPAAGFTIGDKVKQVTTYSGEKCTGSMYVLKKSYACLSKLSMASPIKSVIVVTDDSAPPANCVWVYSDYCYAGQRTEICASNKDLGANGSISSIRIGSAVNNLRIYSSANMSGSTINITKDTATLSGRSIDKNIRSLCFNC